MAWQLIFTSAAAGLQPGSFGYCTVARSAAMRDAIATRLEQFCIYTHSTSGAQPVVCAHRILTLGRATYHVLSRIVNSGVDYTGRTNFLAHHLVLQDFELGEVSSPADIFARWDGWRSQWTEDPRLLTPEEDVFSLRVSAATRLPAENWKAVVGDAAAATWLVNDAGTGARAANLIVPPAWEGEWLLALYAESLCLLDPKGTGTAAWSIPFTTYLQREDDATHFQWRGGWEGGSSRGIAGETVDFTANCFPEVPCGGGMASLARTGMKLEVKQPNISAPAHGRIVPSYTDDPPQADKISRSYSIAMVAPKPRGWWPFVGGGIGVCVVSAAAVLLLASRPRHETNINSALPTPVVSSTQSAPSAETVIVPTPTPPATPTPVFADPEVALSVARKLEVERREHQVADQLAKLPQTPIFITLRSVKTLNVQEVATKNWKAFLERFSADGAPPVNIELRQDRFESVAPRLYAHRAIPRKNQFTEDVGDSPATDDLAYNFSEDRVQVEPSSKVVVDEFIWLTLKPETKGAPAVNFVLANGAKAFGARCPQLSWDVFVRSNSSPDSIELEPDAFKQLSDQLSGWNDLEEWPDDHGNRKRIEVEVTFVNEQTLPASNEGKLSFDNDAGDRNIALANAETDLEDAQRLLSSEAERQKAVERIRQHLLAIKFSEAVTKKLGGDATLKDNDVSDVDKYNHVIQSWLYKVGGDNFEPRTGERFKHIREHQEYYRQLSEILVGLAKDAQDRGPKDEIGIQMLDLINSIRQNIASEDSMFFEQEPKSMTAEYMKTAIRRYADHVASSRGAVEAAKAAAANKPTLNRVKSVWLKGQIDQIFVRLVEFVKR